MAQRDGLDVFALREAAVGVPAQVIALARQLLFGSAGAVGSALEHQHVTSRRDKAPRHEPGGEATAHDDHLALLQANHEKSWIDFGASDFGWRLPRNVTTSAR